MRGKRVCACVCCGLPGEAKRTIFSLLLPLVPVERAREVAFFSPSP
jgi:hypothetical protein